jgi:hypothetical protein
VITNLRLSPLDLLREDELAGAAHSGDAAEYREIPLADGLLGPAHPFPDLRQSTGSLRFRIAELEGVAEAVAVRLAADPQAPPVFCAGDVVLLQLLPGGDRLDPGCYYAIQTEGRGLLRCHHPADGSPDGIVRARAIWIGRHLQARPHRAPAV